MSDKQPSNTDTIKSQVSEEIAPHLAKLEEQSNQLDQQLAKLAELESANIVELARERNLDNQITMALILLGIVVIIMTGGGYFLAAIDVAEPTWAATTISSIIGFIAGHFTNSRMNHQQDKP